MQATEILETLIAFPSVVGTPNEGIVAWIRDYLERHGIPATVLPGPEGDRSNLFATVGPKDLPGYILSGHMDVVPAEEDGWSSDPFRLRADAGRLYGRGTTDMKGFLAAVLAAAPKLAEMLLRRPIHIAFSYDEEAGCRGVPHMIARLPELCEKPLGAIIGEPSAMRAIRAHKGKAAARLTVRGRSGHSSRPDEGLNAVHAITDVLVLAVAEAARLSRGPFESTFEPPYSSLQVGTLRGGQAVNIIPETCETQLEARAISGVDPAGLLDPVRQAAERLTQRGFAVEWQELSAYPALSLPADAPLAALLEGLTGVEPLAAVSYGTEAGLFQQAGIDSIICGPGEIGRAHKADEYILVEELEACEAMIAALGATCAAFSVKEPRR